MMDGLGDAEAPPRRQSADPRLCRLVDGLAKRVEVANGFSLRHAQSEI